MSSFGKSDFLHIPLSAVARNYLEKDGLDPDSVCSVIAAGLNEDLRYGPDITTMATVSENSASIAEINTRAFGVLAGNSVALAVFDVVLKGDYEVLKKEEDGAALVPGQSALVIEASTRGILTAERTALNLLCHLSGIATTTAQWVSIVDGGNCRIRDSRKTLPGLRFLQKYAVRRGGGINHRMGLGDAVLIKDNHVVAAGSVSAALTLARSYAPTLPCEVEVDTLDQLEDVLVAVPDEILLDNFTPQQCSHAVSRRNEIAPEVKLEASGGIKIENARAYADSGVDYLAIGSLTHSMSALDLGLDLRVG